MALAATPLWFTTATVGVDELQVTTADTSWVDPSLNEPLAVNCCEAPSAIVGFGGLTVMFWTVALVMVRVVVAEPWPLTDAVMVTEPAATPVARPCLLTKASA